MPLTYLIYRGEETHKTRQTHTKRRVIAMKKKNCPFQETDCDERCQWWRELEGNEESFEHCALLHILRTFKRDGIAVEVI